MFENFRKGVVTIIYFGKLWKNRKKDKVSLRKLDFMYESRLRYVWGRY